MRETIEFVLWFEDGRKRTFADRTSAVRYADALSGIVRPRKVVRVTTTVKAETVKEWRDWE